MTHCSPFDSIDSPGPLRSIVPADVVRESAEHVDWLETQLHLIDTVGLQNYLSEQMGEDEKEGD